MFYHFSQNNSGGKFWGVANVIIEANSSDEANALAVVKHNIYFDGVSHDLDCACCGDRWYRVWDHNGKEVPTIYGNPVANLDAIKLGVTKPSIMIYYLDGSIKTI